MIKHLREMKLSMANYLQVCLVKRFNESEIEGKGRKLTLKDRDAILPFIYQTDKLNL